MFTTLIPLLLDGPSFGTVWMSVPLHTSIHRWCTLCRTLSELAGTFGTASPLVAPAGGRTESESLGPIVHFIYLRQIVGEKPESDILYVVSEDFVFLAKTLSFFSSGTWNFRVWCTSRFHSCPQPWQSWFAQTPTSGQFFWEQWWLLICSCFFSP